MACSKMMKHARDVTADAAETSAKQARSQPTATIHYVRHSEDATLEPPSYCVGVDRSVAKCEAVELPSMVIAEVPQADVSAYVLTKDRRGSIATGILEDVDTLDELGKNLFRCKSKKQALVLHFTKLLQPCDMQDANVFLVLWSYQGSSKTKINLRFCVALYVDDEDLMLDNRLRSFVYHAKQLLVKSFPRARISDKREAFAVELHAKDTLLECGIVQREWFFPANQKPADYQHGQLFEGYGYPVGVTTYENIFDKEFCQRIEAHIRALMAKPASEFRNENTRQDNKGRIKFFFDARYMWGTQLHKKDKTRGIRSDVDAAPEWFHDVEEHLMSFNLLAPKWCNFHAVNVYVTGGLGLSPHKDDLDRFLDYVLTARFFSASRLVFGGKRHAHVNPKFFIPLPVGGVTVMHHNGYAAQEINHGIRSRDMSGLSASLIFRRVSPERLAAKD